MLWPPDVIADSLEKILMLGKIEGKRREQQRKSWLDTITEQTLEISEDKGAWCAAVHGVEKSQT